MLSPPQLLEHGLFVFRNKNLVPHVVKRDAYSMHAGCDPLVEASPRVCLYVQGLSVWSVINPARTLFDSAVNFKTRLPRPIPIPVRPFTKYFNHDHTRDEASQVGPNCHSLRSELGDREELEQKPVA